MTNQGQDIELSNEDLVELKRVSRIKHHILEKYLPPWQIILGSKFDTLSYWDCYAGPGRYKFENSIVDGSPLIALRAANAYLTANSAKKMEIKLVERSEAQRNTLELSLKSANISNPRLQLSLFNEVAEDFLPTLLAQSNSKHPSFFMIDPYAHPLTVPIINQIVERPFTEALINFMWWRINLDASHPTEHTRVDDLFGNDSWRQQSFMQASGNDREQGFLDYFLNAINAKFKLKFRIKMDPTDKVASSRTKYWLIHATNNVKGALLMKDVMFKLGDLDGTFEYGGRDEQQLPLFTPEHLLKERLTQKYIGQSVSFDGIIEETWDWPFSEKTYRTALKDMRTAGEVKVTPVTSKTSAGLQGQDLVEFLQLQRKLF
jgi:three-Cys-motif partner protein